MDLTLQDPSGSIKKRTGETKGLNKELEKAQRLATGTRTGSRAVRASQLPGMTNEQYGNARGSMGSTGASGRDFANQAQGLGGLVRLYATWAANIFALTAAFSALSQAMNTTNMVQGLDQLGAASGKSLGNLAKKFEEASGGAISLRESMDAVVKASSSGLSDKQVLQIGELAKKTSQALGVSMTDAVSRLTRGITKLEPELLDELSIFTKLGTATGNYAKQVGKAEASLSQFERQQAFANAVITEGFDKFSSINLETNPYDKLLASLKNLGLGILSVVNGALGPLIKLLSENPSILAAGVAMFAGSLIKKVIPALSDYKAQLKSGAEASKAFYDTQAGAAKAAIAASNARLLAQKDAAAELSTAKLDRAENLLKSKMRVRKDVQNILAKTPLEVTNKDLAKLDRLGNSLKTQNNVYKQIAVSIKGAQKANQDYINTAKQVDAATKRGPGFGSAAWKAQTKAEFARRSAVSMGIVSQAGVDVQEKGFGTAAVNAFNSLKTAKLGVIKTAFTGIGVAAQFAAGAINTAVTVLQKFMGIIGVIFGAYQLLSAALSKNGAEVAKFNESMRDVEATTKAAAATTKLYGDTLSVNSVLAKATALDAVAQSTQTLVENLKEAVKSASGLDRLIDEFVLKYLDKDLKSEFASSMSRAVSNGLDQIADPKLKKEAQDNIIALLGIKDIDQVGEAFKNLTASYVIPMGEQVTKVLKDQGEASKKATQPLNDVKEGYKSIDKAILDLGNTLLNNTPLSTYALTLSKQADSLEKSFTTVENRAGILNDILTDSSKIKGFPASMQQDLLNAAEAQKELVELAKERLALQEEERKQNLIAKSAPGTIVGNNAASYALAARMNLDNLDDRMEKTTARVSTSFSRALVTGSKESVKVIYAGLTKAYAEAALSTSKTLLNALPKTPEIIKLQTELELESIQVRRTEITAVRDLTNAMDRDRLSRELSDVDKKIKESNTIEGAPMLDLALAQQSIQQQLTALSSPTALKNSNEKLSTEALAIVNRNSGYLSQMAGLNAQEKNIIITGVVQTIQAGFEQSRVLEERKLEELKSENAKYLASNEFGGLSVAAQQSETFRRQQLEIAQQGNIARLGPQQQIATSAAIGNMAAGMGKSSVYDASQQGVKIAQDTLATSKELEKSASEIAKIENDRKVTLLSNLKILNDMGDAAQHQSNIDQIRQDTASSLASNTSEYLKTQLDLGIITEENYRKQSIALDQINRQREYDNKLSSMGSQLIIDQIALAKEYNQAIADKTETSSIIRRIEARSADYNAQVEGAKRVYDATEQTKNVTESLTDRQLAYGDMIKNSFNGMADALVNWAETGKLSGKELFNSLIADLARYEIKMQMMSIYSNARPGILSAVSSIFMAKGGAFDYGVQAFAKGGAFTNEIVDSPTLFKFAKGTGMMGEAGPEAIMPLTRDGQGNLGVRAGGQSSANVDVVVNNYSTAQATTQETTDSKGNRRIEVMIGEAAASEMSRSGSSSQGTMRNTYGLTPQLIRR